MRPILGTPGNDTISGETGNDTIIGGTGNDSLFGKSGHDWLYGGTDNDSLYGEIGNDRLYGEADHDWLYGGSGNDRLYGGSGNDRLYGEDDHDWLNGGSGNDTIWGGSGNDTIWGGTGNDTIWGGTGNDTYQKETKFDIIVTDTQVVSGVETDILNSIEVVSIYADLFAKDYNIDASALTISGELEGSRGNNKIQGGSGNDLLTGDYGNDTLIGNGGNDTLDGGVILGLSSPTDIDVLISNSLRDRDLFVLGGDSVYNTPYYLDSGIAPNSGYASYARIADFDIKNSSRESKFDQIQLLGVASDYRLGMTTVDGHTGVGIYKTEGSISNLLDDDLIGLVQGRGVSLNTINLTDNNQFVYVV